MDLITIEDLEVHLCIGVPDVERSQPQRLLITIKMTHDFSIAARTDDLNATIDYYAVTRRILGMGEGREWNLIETLAVDVAQLILEGFGARTVRVCVKKFIISEARWVSVEVERDRAA